MSKDIEWLKEEIGELPCVDTVFNSDGSSYIDSAVPVMAVYDLINQLDEPEVLSQESPVIPKIVAKWISVHHERFDLYPALKRLENNALSWEDVYEWYRRNTYIFVNAYLTGKYEVEVEEEQKYRVLDGNTTLLGRINGLMLTTVEILEYYPEYAPTFDFTEQEIKDYDERYLAFKVPVEELKQ